MHEEIDELKSEELLKKQKNDEECLEIRCSNFKKHQEANLNSLLQKIQKDRNDQIKQRQVDSEKLIVRNKSLVT